MTITVEGASAVVAAEDFVGGLATDDRVQAAFLGDRLVVLARAGGDTIPTTVATKAYADALVVTVPKGVIPSSVVVGSGSATVATDGTVTFTAVSSVSLNGVFDGLGGDSYQVVAYMAGTTSATYSTRLRAAGTDVAGTSYDRVATYTQLASGPTRASATGTSAFGFWSLTSTGTTRTAAGTMTLLNPKAALASIMQLHATLNANSDLYDWHESAKGPTTACDGLTILASAGTITGTIKVVKVS